MQGPGLCLDESYIDLGYPHLALQRDALGFTKIKLPVCAAFDFVTGKPSSNFSTLSTWGFSTADKSFVLGTVA